MKKLAGCAEHVPPRQTGKAELKTMKIHNHTATFDSGEMQIKEKRHLVFLTGQVDE